MQGWLWPRLSQCFSQPFRTRLVAIERGRIELSNATSLILNGSSVQKWRPFERSDARYSRTVRRREMRQNGGDSARRELSIPLGPIFLPLPVPEIAKTGLILMADISWVYEPFKTKLVAIEEERNDLSNETSLVLNGLSVQKWRSF